MVRVDFAAVQRLLAAVLVVVGTPVANGARLEVEFDSMARIETALLELDFGLVVQTVGARLEVEVCFAVGVEVVAIGSPLQSTGQDHGVVAEEVVGDRICPLVQFVQLAEADRALVLGSQAFAVVAAWDVFGRPLDFPWDFLSDFHRDYFVLTERKAVKVAAIGRIHLLHRTHCHRRSGPSDLGRIVAAVLVVALVLWDLEEDHEAAELSRVEADVVCCRDCNLSAAAVLSSATAHCRSCHMARRGHDIDGSSSPWYVCVINE